MIEVIIRNQHFLLLPEKCIFWVEKQYLLFADLHLGKASHFRKAGIQVPQNVEFENLTKLQDLFLTYSPKKVLFLGDLFHSETNKIWTAFLELINQFSSIEFLLIKGNHDILPTINYQQKNFILIPEFLEDSGFAFSHEKMDFSDAFLFYGHIHPGVRLKASARQSARLPCFFMDENSMILPAFGAFTGLQLMPVKKQNSVFVIANHQVVPI